MKDEIQKIAVTEAPNGSMDEKLLVSTGEASLRFWHEVPPEWPNDPSQQKDWTTRRYDTLGYVIRGKAELQAEDKTLELREGDSWIVPRGVRHRYVVKETLQAIEATTPPARDLI